MRIFLAPVFMHDIDEIEVVKFSTSFVVPKPENALMMKYVHAVNF